MYTAIACMLLVAPLAALAAQDCIIAPPSPSYTSPTRMSSTGGFGGLQTTGAVSGGMPSAASESQLYQAVMPYDQYAQGYGTGADTGVQRIDNPPVEQPVQEETQPGQDQVKDHTLPDEQREGRVDLNKEIHNYLVQRKTVNVNNRILHRYLKNLLVRTIYNTNIQRVNHKKLMNMIMTTLQETHQPKLLVKYSREDRTQDQGERSEQPEVSEDRQDRTLPPIFEPATAEKIGYDGNALGPAVSAGGSSGFSTGGGRMGGSGSFSGASSSSGSSGFSAAGARAFGRSH